MEFIMPYKSMTRRELMEDITKFINSIPHNTESKITLSINNVHSKTMHFQLINDQEQKYSNTITHC